MALPNNILQQVETYQMGGLARLQNFGCFVSESNTKFKDFENLIGNLGSTVTFSTPSRYTTKNTLVADFQPTTQLFETLAVNQAVNTSYAFDAQQFVFNVKDFMMDFGIDAAAELGTVIEANIGLNGVSGVVDNDPRSSTFGQKQYKSGPFRFYGDGTTPINSFGQLAQMLANFRNFGAPKGDLKVFLPDTIVPQIVNSGLNQFVLDRNERDANSWEVGNWSGVNFYQSNLLPSFTAGTVGDEDATLTLISTNDPTGANITQLTFSGAAANDPVAIRAGDLLQFQASYFYRTYIGHIICKQPVQFRSNFDVLSDGSGHVTIDITPTLCSVAGDPIQNLNIPLQPGVTATVLPSHTAGFIVSSNALFLGMPRLPDQRPYDTANKSDPDTGVSVRFTYGSLFGQNQQGFINDAIWGSHLPPLYSMRIAFPPNQ